MCMSCVFETQTVTLETACLLCGYLWRASCRFMKRVKGGGGDYDYSPWQSYPETGPCVRPARPPTILHHPAVCSRWCRPPSGSTHRPAEPHSRTPPRPPLSTEGERQCQRERETESLLTKSKEMVRGFTVYSPAMWFWCLCWFYLFIQN